MSRINWNRVILGGLLAGLVINLCEFAVNTALADDWAVVMKSLGKSGAMSTSTIVIFNIWGFLMGGFAIWLYAAIRPRYGAGPSTAACAGLAVWFAGYLLSLAAPAAMDLFPIRLMAIALVAGLVEVVAGTLLGAWLYREIATGQAPAAGS